MTTNPVTETPAPDLRALRELAEAATPGEWFAHIRTQSAEGAHPHVGWVSTERNNVTVVDNAWDGDAAFIAAANPTAVLALLDRLEAAEAAVERVRALADEWDEDHKRHLAVTRRSAPNHRPCESGARAKAGQMIRATLGAD